MTNGKIAEIALNEGDCDNSDDEDDYVNTGKKKKKVHINNVVKMYDRLTERLEQ